MTLARVVITGASRGIGLELTRQHLARGDEVLATARAPSPALRSLASDRLTIHELDVTDPSALERLATACRGPVDVLWSNAGIFPGTPGTSARGGGIGELSFRDGLEVFATNSVGALLVVQALLPRLLEAERPKVLALSSGYGSLTRNQGAPYWYGASKAALNMLFRSLAFDSKARGLTVAMVSPGWTQTDMGSPNAPQPLEPTVRGLLQVLDGLGPEHHGAFLDYQGRPVPW